MKRFIPAVLCALLVALPAIGAAPGPAMADPYQPVPYVKVQHPEWSKNATIYQLNTRQFSAEGTFRAAEKELPRIKALNVDIVWLMPIHPIGEKNRKGTLGSPYAVQDYLKVNPEFGTLDDFKHFVATAHQLGFKVILDWVMNNYAKSSVSSQGDFNTNMWLTRIEVGSEIDDNTAGKATIKNLTFEVNGTSKSIELAP